MTIESYLKATGQSQSAFARAIGIPQRTFSQIVQHGGSCHVAQAEAIINGSMMNPAPRRPGARIGHVTLKDLAAGARRYVAQRA